MIRHITLYQLKDSKDRECFAQCLRKLETCPFITTNNVYLNMEEGPSLPIVADVMHEAFFATEDDAKAFPSSKEHLQVVKETCNLLKCFMTLDYFDE